MVMTSLEDGVVEGFIIRNVNTSLVGKDASFDLPVRQASVERERNALIHRLESLEDKGITCRGRFNVMGESYVDHIDEERWGKESDFIIVIICVRKKIRVAGEGICSCQELSRYMDHFQIEVGEVEKPSGLSMIDGLGRAEVGKVFVVGKDLHGKWGSMEVVSPGFQGMDDGKEFSVVDVVVSFSWGDWER